MPKSVFTEAYRAVIASLRDARLKAGVSQVELALRIGKPQQFVSLIEQGVRRVDVVEYVAVMRALGQDPIVALTALARGFPNDLSI
jgi:transcriptional regulator with XRE-family HTH domain